MHDHNFKATDIPGVCLCKCGAETYYVSESQYYVSRGRVMLNKREILEILLCKRTLNEGH
jgi:hypothetical protein